MSKRIEHFWAGSVYLAEFVEGRGSLFIVEDPGHYCIRFYPDREDGTFRVGIDAEWRDDAPGVMANYTPVYESGRDDCSPGEVTISNDDVLSVLTRQRTSSRMVIRIGWTAQLPADAVEPIRRAIALTEAQIAGGRP